MRMNFLQGRVVSAAVLAVALAGSLAACGGSSSPQVASLGSAGSTNANGAAPSSSTGVDREAAARGFASCMRKNGVTTFPDPTVDSNGNVQMGLGPNSGINRDDPTVRKAFT
ncbi:MAG: hypothetical protein WCP81_09770, partial [Actinomycetes bacterium]